MTEPFDTAGVPSVPFGAPPASPAADKGLSDLFAQPTPATAPHGRMSVADQAAMAAEAAFDLPVFAEVHAPSDASSARIFELSDQITSVVANDPALQLEFSGFELTRDESLDRLQRTMFEQKTAPALANVRGIMMSPGEAAQVWDVAYDEYIGISVLGSLWRDDSITEICVDRWDKIVAERDGKLEITGLSFRSPGHADGVIRQLSIRVSDRAVSNTNSLVTAELPQARVMIVWGALSAGGLAVTIRKFRPLLGMDALLTFGSLTEEMAEFLCRAVEARATVLVSGGTGTGKTTMINSLSEAIPDTERVITIEDSFELQLSNTHVVSLQAKTKASADDQVTVGQDDLLIASLRMRPDRIIVGEVRESSAAQVMLTAANTGHDGTMCTIHANSPTAALNTRLVTLLSRGAGYTVETARADISTAIDLVVQITRHERSGRRFVSEIAVVPTVEGRDPIRPRPVFQASIVRDADGVEVPDFRYVAPVGADTELGLKMAHSSEQAARWVENGGADL